MSEITTFLGALKRVGRCRALPCWAFFLALLIVPGPVRAAQPQSDLAIAVSVNNPLPNVSDQITYTLTVTNYGPSDVNNVQVTDVLPSNVVYVSDTSAGAYDNTTGLWTVVPVKLVSGSSVSIDITVTVNPPAVGNSFSNTATVGGGNHPDPNASNDNSSVVVTIAGANLTMLKSALTISDPVNGTSSPYNIPGATLLYSLQTTNSGQGPADTDTVVITDPIPANTMLYVGDLGSAGSGPVLFIDGAAPAGSGLTYSFTGLSSSGDDLEFSNDNGASWTYTPVADANGYDVSVTNIRVNPKGVMNASNGTTNPNFILRFRVMVK